ncbi:hypothetical protein GGI43DRAFT_310128 [Trichoderma evansii]
MAARKRIVCDYPYRRKKRERKRPASNSIVSPISSLLTDRSPGSGSAENSGASPNYYESLHLAPLHPTGANFLTERFLDPEGFRSAQLKVPEPDVDYLITKDVSDFVGDVANIKAISDKFFDSVHEWMPIISKIQFLANLVSSLTHKRAELFFLILSMKLVCEQGSSSRTPLYQVTKQLQHKIENSGVLSLRVVQASVLIIIYELGNGIYPSAFLSIASSARYACAVDVDKSIQHREISGISWPELEERRRAWWSLLVLDRFLNLSDPSRHLVTADPVLENWLPVDDATFNAGTSRPEDAFTLGSANALNLGRFARFAQAAHLLGQVLHHVAQKSPENETAQLRRTIFSLVNVSSLEAKFRRLEFCAQTSVCYCGILLLDCSQSSRDPNCAIISLDRLSLESSLISQTVLQISLYITQRTENDIHSRSSPFLLHMMYRVAMLYLKASKTSPSESLADKLHVIKQGLEALGRRYYAAHSYLSLLSRHQIMQAMQ